MKQSISESDEIFAEENDVVKNIGMSYPDPLGPPPFERPRTSAERKISDDDFGDDELGDDLLPEWKQKLHYAKPNNNNNVFIDVD